MLYVANFSYTDESEAEDNYCLMPCVVEAADAEEALERFTALIERLHDSTELLAGASEVYLDSLVEMAAAPQEAIVTQWQKIIPTEDGLVSVASALPEADLAEATAYAYEYVDDEDELEGIHDDLVDDEYEDEDAEDDLQEPFIVFE